MTKWLLLLGLLAVLVGDITCPPVQPEIKPVEGDSPDDMDQDPGFGLEYDRYLKEIVMALEEDEAFRKKLEEMNMSDIKSGKIAQHLDLVSHQIRERLDEIKRQEINRLRMLAREKMKQMNGTEVLGSLVFYGGIQRMDETYLHHVDVKNPHSFETKDLEKLIRKATQDLDDIDKKRRDEFKTYEMEKEHQRREQLKNLDEEHKKAREEELEQMKKRHEDHPKLHHPGSKDQLEDVWEKTDNMDPSDFDPKTFFKLHDLDGNGFLDQDEVEALFQKELDQVYDPNMPEDDMRERYEDMARMREHVFSELDKDKDRLISLEEFLNYTASQEFEKDEGWKTVDEEQNFTDEEYKRYEEMLREHEERMRAQGLDPNMAQPGMVPLGHDPNVQHMQMPQGGQGMPQGGHGMPPGGHGMPPGGHGMPPGGHGMPQGGQDMPQRGQGMNQPHQQQQFQRHEQEQQMRQMGQMPVHPQSGGGNQMHMGQGHMQGQMGQAHMQGQMNREPIQGQMGQDHMQGQMDQRHMQGQMGQGHNQGQMNHGRMKGQMGQEHMQGQMGGGFHGDIPPPPPPEMGVGHPPGMGAGHEMAGPPGMGVGHEMGHPDIRVGPPGGPQGMGRRPPKPPGLTPQGQGGMPHHMEMGQGMPPAQGQPPRQQFNAQGQQPVQGQGQDTLKFQGQGQQEAKNKPLV